MVHVRQRTTMKTTLFYYLLAVYGNLDTDTSGNDRQLLSNNGTRHGLAIDCHIFVDIGSVLETGILGRSQGFVIGKGPLKAAKQVVELRRRRRCRCDKGLDGKGQGFGTSQGNKDKEARNLGGEHDEKGYSKG